MEADHLRYKTRNILSVVERIKVIKAYESIPCYQRLATQFGCSTKQIRNIINNKHNLLKNYKISRNNKAIYDAAKRRLEKINFLGKVVYEFLLRALYLRQPIGTAIIRQIAFEVKEAIAIENFTPNQAWLDDFRKSNNRLDLANMMENLPADMDKRRSLKCIDLIEYVSKQERENKQENVAEDENCNSLWEHEYFGDDIAKIVNTLENNEGSSEVDDGNTSSHNRIEINRKPEKSRCVDYNGEFGANCHLKAETVNTLSTNNNNLTPQSVSDLPPLPDIHSYLEALRHLKVLEDFAMIEENFRAIGLISQLEQIFKNPPELKRIAN